MTGRPQAHAMSAAVQVARGFGLHSTEPSILADGSNVLVQLRPAPVVARVASLTALVRPGVAAWLARDIEISAYLDDCGIPVVRPSVDPPAGPHHQDGMVLTFSEYLPHDPDYVPAPADVAGRLAELHEALLGFPGVLSEEGPTGDLRHGLDLLEGDGVVGAGELAALRADAARLAGEIRVMPARPLHGDAHPGNLLATANGLVWNDFEDTWRGPLAWDLACLANTKRLDGSAALAAYPGLPPERELYVCLRLRRLFGVCWRFVLARRFPDRTADAEQHLRDWLTRQVP